MAIEMKPLWGIVAMGVTSRCKAVAIEMKPLRGIVAMGVTSRCKAVAIEMKPLWVLWHGGGGKIYLGGDTIKKGLCS